MEQICNTVMITADEYAELKAALEAAQAREKVLRDALAKLEKHGVGVTNIPKEGSFDALKAALAAERESERERCAKLCIDLRRANYSGETGDWIDGTEDCAKAIRALGDE